MVEALHFLVCMFICYIHCILGAVDVKVEQLIVCLVIMQMMIVSFQGCNWNPRGIHAAKCANTWGEECSHDFEMSRILERWTRNDEGKRLCCKDLKPLVTGQVNLTQTFCFIVCKRFWHSIVVIDSQHSNDDWSSQDLKQNWPSIRGSITLARSRQAASRPWAVSEADEPSPFLIILHSIAFSTSDPICSHSWQSLFRFLSDQNWRCFAKTESHW